MEWLSNIGQWFAVNYEGIVAFLSSANMASMIGNIAFIFKQSKMTVENTASVKTLTDALSVISDLKSVMEDTIEQNKQLAMDLQSLRCKNDELDATLTSTENKLNGIIDALIVVYSTVKDETVRRTVENILTATKYDELPAINDEIQCKIVSSVQEMVSKVTEDLSKDFVTKKEFDTNKTVKKSKTTTRY